MAFLKLIALNQRQDFPRLLLALKSTPYHEIVTGKCGEVLKKESQRFSKILYICWKKASFALEVDYSARINLMMWSIYSPATEGEGNQTDSAEFAQRSDHNAAHYSINELRERFYVMGRERTVKFLIKDNSKTCCNRRASSGSQIMSPLPAVRLESGKCWFTATSVDFMGPIPSGGLIHGQTGRSPGPPTLFYALLGPPLLSLRATWPPQILLCT